jgi:4-diphosphocytidyl-2-C-methyl-D-erythritol kinase
VPVGRDNLAVRAAEAFRSASGIHWSIDLHIEKRIPMGAGLGGGSSNASAVLLGLDALFGHPLSVDVLSGLAASLGSDCPLFLAGGPCVMRGRGERVAPLPERARRRVSGRRVLLFKPDFAVPTAWAYATLAAMEPSAYLDQSRAEATVAEWMEGAEEASRLLFNSFERVVCRKFVALATLAGLLRGEPGVDGVLLSGSGSACFALLNLTADPGRLSAVVRNALGESAWIGISELA